MNRNTRPGLLRNLQIGFGLSLLLLIITSVASYSSIQNLLEGARRIDHTDSVIIKLDRIMSVLRDAESGQRGYLLTGDENFLANYEGAQDKMRAIVDSVEEMTADNPRQGKSIEQLRQTFFLPLTTLRVMIDQKRAAHIYDTTALLHARDQMRDAQDLLRRMENEERRLMTFPVGKVPPW